MPLRLQDRVAVITGAGGGIGRAISLAFAREGASVVLADIDEKLAGQTAAIIAGLGGNAMAVQADVADPASVQNLRDVALAHFGKVNVLMNNAAIQVNRYIEDTSPEDWSRQMAVNVGGVFLCSKYFMESLRRTEGCIINMSSVNATIAEPMCAGYCASKAAILGFTRALAIDHGKEGIRVNAICPGYIDSGLAEGYFQAQADPAAARAQAGKLHALGRIGAPLEVAQVAVFLASDDAAFVTGAAYHVDGGFTAGLCG